MIILLILLSILLILFLMPIKIEIYYEFTNISKYKIIISYLFGLLKKEIDSTKKEIKKNKKSHSDYYKIDTYEFTKYFIDKGKIEKFYLNTNIGLKDPFLLGITVGILWAIINIFISFFIGDNYINKIRGRNISVTPFFNEDIFQVFFMCIIKVNLVYIITVYRKFLKKRKGGDTFARTSHRRLNENYNG